MIDLTINITGLQGRQCNEGYVRALVTSMLHDGLEVDFVHLEVTGDGAYSGVGPVEGHARITLKEPDWSKNPVLKYLLQGEDFRA